MHTGRTPRHLHPTAIPVLVACLLVGACAPAPTWDQRDRLPNDWGAGVIRPDVTDIVYDAGQPDRAHRGDLYLPRKGPARGVIVYAHGGGFTAGARADLHRYAGPLLRELNRGFAIFNVDYGVGPFPAAVHDLATAVRWVRSEQATALGVHATAVIVAGHSAGGTIVADLALAANRGAPTPFRPLPGVDGWIAVAAPLDLDAQLPWGGSARAAWRTGAEPAASPAANLDRHDPPGLVIHGDQDGIVPTAHATLLRDRARAVGYQGLALDLVTNAPTECRNHAPMCGASMAALDRFVDRAAARR